MDKPEFENYSEDGSSEHIDNECFEAESVDSENVSMTNSTLESLDKGKNKKRKRKKRLWLRILLIVLASLFGLLLIAVIAGVIIFNNLLNLMERTPAVSTTMSREQIEQYIMENTETIPDDYTGEILTDEDIDWGTVDVKPIPQGDHIINFLLVGKDRISSGICRTDSIILCTINKSKKEITLTSFMRDLYLKLPNGYNNRINASYVFGGIDLLKRTMEETFGVKVDGTFEVDFDGFQDVIDLIGGVEITFDKSEANYMNKYTENRTRTFSAGTYTLKGNEALAYARMRYVGGDTTRTLRQRTILSKVFEKCHDMSPSQLYKLMEKVLPLITTNLTNGQIMSYSAQLLPMLSKMKLNTDSRVPYEGSYKMCMVNKMSVLVADLDANRRMLEELMKP